MKMKLSKHSKIRMRERTDFNHKERQQLFRNALLNGKYAHEIKNEKIKCFMELKGKRCQIKLYRGYLFLFSKNSHQLYTMYKLPEELGLEEETQ